MKENRWTEGALLPILSLVLVSVFCLSVYMYDDLCAAGESGALAVFASGVRDFVEENVALEEAEEGTTVAVQAEEYIARYNAIYRDLQ